MLPGALAGRQFTGPNGVTVEGEPVAATSTVVTIRTLGGKDYQLALSGLNAADQTYVNEWRENHQKYAFIINVAAREVAPAAGQVRLPGSTKGKAAVEISAHNWCYQVTVSNMSREQTPAMKMAYTLFVQDATSIGDKAAAGPQNAGTGTADLPALAPGGAYVFDTDSITLGAWKPPPGYHFSTGHGQYHRTVLAGLEGTLSLGDKTVWRYNSMAKPGR